MVRTAGGAARWLLAAIAIAALAVLALPSFAGAAPSHHYVGTFDTGEDPIYPFGPCNVHDLDVDAQENVYVLCGGQEATSNNSGAVVKKFDKNGNPVPFTATQPYIAGNAIIENPDPNGNVLHDDLGRTFGGEGHIAVDASNGPTAGYIYVQIASTVEVMNPTGKFVGSMSAAGLFGIQGVTTDSQGNVYYNSQFKIDKRDQSLTIIGQLYAAKSNSEFGISPGAEDLAIDSTGSIWALGNATEDFPENSVSLYEPDQFGLPEQESTFALGTHKVGKRSPLAESPLVGFGAESTLSGTSITVDRSDDHLFVERSFPNVGILEFNRGANGELSHQVSAPIGDLSSLGGGPTKAAKGMAIGSGGTIFAGHGDRGVSRFVAGGALPTVSDHPVALDDVGHTDVTVRGKVELAGGGPITGCEIVYGPTREYGLTAPCSPNPTGSNFTQDTEVSTDLTGLTTESDYHFAIVATNAEGSGFGIDRPLRPAAVLGVETDPATDVTSGTATFQGDLDPGGASATYRFEYGLAGEITASTDESAPVSGGEQHVSVPVTELGTGKQYQYRMVATNSLGTTRGPVRTFQVAGPPALSGVHAVNVRSEDADLRGQVNPVGYPTTYRFEYGPTTSYGSTVPADPGDAGEGSTNTEVTNHLTGLEPGRVYHYRLVASNKWGTTNSDDTTFNFLPETCPNEHVRQEMKSSFLPDCRAYELVSPGNAGGAEIYPGNEAFVQGTVGFPAFTGVANTREIQNTGFAGSPSRFAYYAGLGAIGGLEAPNVFLDQYTATRTTQGWNTTFSGIGGTEAGGTGRKVCSISLDKCFDHLLYNPFVEAEEPKNWGYLFDLDGKKTGIAPTNAESVENGTKFIGDIRPSPELDHLAFSSSNAAFTEDGQTAAAPGSAYDNDLETGTVSLISKLGNGSPIPSGGEKTGEFITFPPTGISRDGSHILMETLAPDGPNRIYMRVNDTLTYEIGLPEAVAPGNGQGAGVKFIGMSTNGTRVLFLATQQLTAEDTDASADIYMWQENSGSPTLTLVTKGNGQGDSDTCAATWTSKCSVQLLETERGDRSGFGPETEELPYSRVTFAGMDSKLASNTGGVYFFSPETLAGTAPRNGKNLYLANGGEIHYVATIGGSETIDRIQISPDGEHAGFLTRARLTPYDNEEFEEMYSYTPKSGVLKCVSCLPSGAAPTADVEASQNGPFMADDGRLFFSTSDPLVPADADPFRIPDVYEFTSGRPQLISSGTSSSGRAPGGAGTFISETLGLESVSSNGQDVFFSTTDSLVPQDSNGNFPKIYDARTGGGFEVAAQPAPCVAADECHGAGAETPAPLQVGTGSSTTGGNVPAAKKPHHKKPKAKKKHRKGKKQKAHKRHGSKR